MRACCEHHNGDHVEGCTLVRDDQGYAHVGRCIIENSGTVTTRIHVDLKDFVPSRRRAAIFWIAEAPTGTRVELNIHDIGPIDFTQRPGRGQLFDGIRDARRNGVHVELVGQPQALRAWTEALGW